jgi:diguanylate cyclase (GGDEF)-like protein
VFESSESVNVCPKLRDRPYGPCSAVCVPVNFMGRALGVLHTTAPDRQPPESAQVQRLAVLATEIGTRIGTVRAFATTQLQAATDSLTGLANRRTLEDHVAKLTREMTPYCLAIADLDHFKRINDTHGHDAGDRALRLFSRVLRASVRSVDMAARYGGEEFVIVLPDCDTIEAAGVLERVREQLTIALLDGRSPAFTTSFGLTAADPGTTMDEAMAQADAALYRAKAGGRNRIVVADTSSPAERQAVPVPSAPD